MSQDFQPGDHARIEADIQRLESGIKQLKVQYDMFFAGALKTEPWELKNQLERLVKFYRTAPIQKYQYRFHINALISRFNTMSELWGRSVRDFEEGGRSRQRDENVRERLLARCRVSETEVEDPSLKRLYDQFSRAREQSGKGNVSYSKFVRGVAAQAQQLQKNSGCAEIELRLVVKDQQVQLKARPVR